MNSHGRLKGTLFIFLCVGAWALIPVVSKLGQTRMDNHQFLFWSSLISFLALGAWSMIKGCLEELIHLKAAEWLYLAVLGLLGTYIYYLFLYLGYAVGNGMEILVIQYSWPILIVILSLFIHKEKLTLKKVLSLILGFTGVLFVLTKGNLRDIQFDNAGLIILVALGAFCFALFSVLGGRVKVNPFAANTVYFLMAAAASFVSMLLFSGWETPGAEEIIPVALNGVVVNGFSYVLWIVALRDTSPGFAAPFTYLTPVLSAFYLVFIFQEPFFPAYGIGLFLVLAGGLINSLDRGKRRLP